jgi:hypothetical protein
MTNAIEKRLDHLAAGLASLEQRLATSPQSEKDRIAALERWLQACGLTPEGLIEILEHAPNVPGDQFTNRYRAKAFKALWAKRDQHRELSAQV